MHQNNLTTGAADTGALQPDQHPEFPPTTPLLEEHQDINAPGHRQTKRPSFFHAPQNSLGGYSTSSEDTYTGEPSATGFPDVFQDLEKSRSITAITALTPNRAKFELTNDIEQQHPEDPQPGKLHHPENDIGPYSPDRPKLTIKQRLKHFTWAWYTLTMSTGGLSLLIFAQPHQFPGLRTIGSIIYVLNTILFSLVTLTMLSRFFLYPGTFTSSIAHKREGFFFPTFFLSLATLITSTQRYAVPSEKSPDNASPALLWTIQVAFWIYLVLTTLLAIFQYSYIFASHHFGLHTMMPTWILPIFPIMLSGTIASVIAGTQPASQAVSIITAGLTCQGLGLAVAGMMYAHMVGRLMQSGLPDREHRPGLFMCVGPPAFTALALIGLAKALPESFDHDGDGFIDTSGIQTTAIIAAGFLWALSLWWFGIAAVAVVIRPPRWFHLGWWAGVFPNTGFVLATISLGGAFRNEPVLWVCSGVSVLVVGVYLFVLGSCVRAVVVQDIVYPGRDEDVEDH